MNLIKYADNFGRIFYVTSTQMMHNYKDDSIKTLYFNGEINVSRKSLDEYFERIGRGVYRKVM